ncbi:ER-golgi trafficking TRAPP I complex 85 kDa subunit-domain-containing protein [Elsinoe ampelina]|uniref:ER-golgi trafficking TRAPP I complex 85 kDa subunit-domain-containing protein n=1 Tax=Elsinoe ampelina TaxID=302913 RepID=A0A6A6GM49_9PEZI|nr:ER-golgi trafficking TRAPP I complex 85 kDa subunit-domain-containing protein [Elsinoe ampelina]
MSSADDHPLKSSPPLDTTEAPLPPPKDVVTTDRPKKPSIDELSTGRTMSSSASVTSSTLSSSTSPPITSRSSTPTVSTLAGSVFSPTGSKYDLRSSTGSPISPGQIDGAPTLVAQAFAPHVSVLSSPDCEELLRHKGINGGLLELLRPFGEMIPGRVVIRDSTGVSKPWDDFGIRFTGIKDGLEAPRMGRSPSESKAADGTGVASEEHRPARLRSGGDVVQIEQLVERHLDELSAEANVDGEDAGLSPSDHSPYFGLYQRKLLSGTVLSPHETFAHPVALVIAISSRSAAPIEDLRTLYTNSNTGEYRLPPWVNNEYLRYYVLVHDEDFDDIKKSTTLYEQMKRHFGLHCHLLRLRSTQCLPSDDGATLLPAKNWTSAAEDLSDMSAIEAVEDDAHTLTYIFESDATAVRSFVREMVTQSILPSMERSVATWNDQVASRRRGISGRFMSLSKRFTPFGGRSNSPSTSGTNYDSAGGFYRPDLPEAIMRKLADYAVMLRDYKLAASTYEILCGDYKNDKAWRCYAGANEMAAVTSLLSQGPISARARSETIDTWIENAYYSYFTRCNSAFYSLRTIVLTAELLRIREGSALDDAARWLARTMDDRNIGPVGHALLLERTGSYFALKKGVGSLHSGKRRRKAALWFTLAASAWLDMDKQGQAGRCLSRALEIYDQDNDGPLHFDGMQYFLDHLGRAVEAKGPEKMEPFPDVVEEKVEQIQQTTVDQRTHRRSGSLAVATPAYDPLGVGPMTPKVTLTERLEAAEDGFE